MSTNKKEIKHGLNTVEELELPEWGELDKWEELPEWEEGELPEWEELDSIRAGVKQW